ncbi:MAG: ribonuclease J [Anaerolineae bacterium]|jgi:ribonuclease J
MSSLRIIPLGGLGEIGRNMLVVEYDGELLIVDAGIMFPDNDMLGIDVVIPDMSYVFERADRVRAIIITHGHEDHIGALPYLLEQVSAPLYATKLTLGLIKVKLPAAFGHSEDLRVIDPDERLALGPFGVSFFRVSHSIPDGVGLAIETPVGLVVHSGDFKFDHSPINGQRTEFTKLAQLGGQGVRLLLSDSTNAESPGYTPSEAELAKTLARVFGSSQGRVIVATFASNTSRIQQVIETSRLHGRRVAIVGRSMLQNVRVARELGYLQVEDDDLVPVDQVEHLPEERVTLICTGSQGEPTSALVRLGQSSLRSVSITPGDTVIVSASPIPGNEEYVNRTLDNLFRLGARVFYDEVLDVHVSGHASQEEQKMLINLLQPEFFVPIHGEYRHLVLHRELAQRCDIPRENTFLLETGDVLELDGQGARVVEHVSGERVLVDRHGLAEADNGVMQHRTEMATNGVLVAVVLINKYTGSLLGEPHLEMRGFCYPSEEETVRRRAQEAIAQVVARGGTRVELLARLEQELARVAHAETGRRPVIIPVLSKT